MNSYAWSKYLIIFGWCKEKAANSFGLISLSPRFLLTILVIFRISSILMSCGEPWFWNLFTNTLLGSYMTGTILIAQSDRTVRFVSSVSTNLFKIIPSPPSLNISVRFNFTVLIRVIPPSIILNSVNSVNLVCKYLSRSGSSTTFFSVPCKNWKMI